MSDAFYITAAITRRVLVLPSISWVNPKLVTECEFLRELMMESPAHGKRHCHDGDVQKQGAPGMRAPFFHF
jgi:hypothetical protein